MIEDQRMHDEIIEQDQDLSFGESSLGEFVSIDTPSIQMSAAVSSNESQKREYDFPESKQSPEWSSIESSKI